VTKNIAAKIVSIAKNWPRTLNAEIIRHLKALEISRLA